MNRFIPRACVVLLSAALSCVFLDTATAQPSADVRNQPIIAAYQRFVAAQNDRDLARVRDAFIDSPDFLWVSDGKSFWTRDEVIKRMSGFQTLEVWHAEPRLAQARVVHVSADVAYLHMPLALSLGTKAAPSLTRFLVSILFKLTPDGWKIAALFTTYDTP